MHVWHPHRCWSPIARWSQMAALGATICKTWGQVWWSITSVSKPCGAWWPLLGNRVGKAAGTLKPSHMYHNSLLAMHQGPYRRFLTMRKQFYFPNMLPKIQKYVKVCTLCQRTKVKNTKQRPYYGWIPTEYIPCKNLKRKCQWES